MKSLVGFVYGVSGVCDKVQLRANCVAVTIFITQFLRFLGIRNRIQIIINIYYYNY